ncbi:VWA domain-containing protein [Heliomarina baculiformis]|uniref:VWA domain-containing protein n=1 Tax=Heliomarina baculiformis TaxID=2872036 RepID=UPI001EE1922E|nr:VWA domain-containing protein [Heliomarina baculiformis]
MNFSLAIEVFHFLRPLWLLLLPLIVIAWWMARRQNRKPAQLLDRIAPHLRKALTVGDRGHRRIEPIDGVALLLALACLGAAGPTWSRVPDPFVAQTAPVVIALKVTPSMESDDLAPSRLERAKQKIRDLLDLRAGARTALVAYAGSAHAVVPMTEDANVLYPYLDGLSPDVMPAEGADALAAIALAETILAKEPTPGGILLVADALDSAQARRMAGTEGTSLAVLSMLPSGTNDPGLDAVDIPVIEASVDDSDIRQLDRQLNAAYQRALTESGNQPWDDRGWMLAWPAMLLALLWFRRGWTMRWAHLWLAAFLLVPVPQARADSITDWFFTPDQQGRLAYDRKDYERAAELFQDPMWRGWALMRDGQYDEAAKVFHRIETPEASFAEGLSHIRNRAYRDGIDAYETTLERDPNYPGAAENLALAREILDYVETAREQSDTGEDEGIGADEVVFDNEDERGADTEMEAGEESGDALLTTDQWMNTVDTNTGDFLRQRFAIEAAQQTGEASR